MSGFVGILRRDGQPAEPARLESLTRALRFRGPDGTRTWHQGSIGLGHSLLVTDRTRDGAPQPLELDGRLRLVGHVRLDARDELRNALKAPATLTDGALVLAAYAAWGNTCIQRIDGDFSFAIWDEPNQRLFCARDRFGVRPFFYAPFADVLVFGNTLSVLRLHPSIGASLDQRTIADFLLAGHPLQPDTTFFADVRRLPPAHTLELDAASCRVQRYWTLPAEPLFRYRRPDDYVAHFSEVLTQAVGDRVGDAGATLQMSGGLDSGAIAAALTGKLTRWRPAGPVRGVCNGFNTFFADPEPALARASAEALGLPFEVWEEDEGAPFTAWDAGDLGPEPAMELFRGSATHNLRRLRGFAPVVLNGQGGDEVFACDPLLDELARSGDARLIVDWFHGWLRFRRPAIGLRGLGARRRRQRHVTAIPDWLDSAWVGSVNLRGRAEPAIATPEVAGARQAVRRRLSNPLWPPHLEGWDAGLTRACVEVRFPFLDRRLVQWFLRLPPYPWCVDKLLARQALSASLPQTVRRRPKTPLQGDPLISYLERNPAWPAKFGWAGPEIEAWVNPARWLGACETLRPSQNPERAWELMRVVALAYWLRHSRTGAPPASLA